MTREVRDIRLSRTECQAKNESHAPYKYLISYVKEKMPFHFNTVVAHTVLHRIDTYIQVVDTIFDANKLFNYSINASVGVKMDKAT